MNFSLIQPSQAAQAAGQPPGVSGALAALEQLFDHVRETAFFLKDNQGRYLAVNQSMVERCRVRDKHDLIGRHVREIFPKELAEVYAREDQMVLKTGHPILDRLELHWYESRKTGWCLTTKLPMRNAEGQAVMYIHGKRDAEMRIEQALPVNLEAFTLGGWTSGGRRFIGRMADLRLCNRVLTPTEIQSLPAGRPTADGLVAAWGLADLHDATGQGHDLMEVK